MAEMKDGTATRSLGRQAARALTWGFIDLAGVKVIFLVRLLVLARLLAPEEFGLLAVAMAAITVLMTLSDFGVVPALIQHPVLSKQDYDAGWTLGVMRAALATVVLLLAAPLVADLFGDSRATPIIQVLACGVILDALASIKIAELNRDLNFRSLAIIHVVNAIVVTIIAIVMAPAYGVWALVAGSLAGSLATTVTSYIVAPYRPRFCLERSTVSGLLNFGRWIFLTGLIVMLANAGLRVIISRELGVAELGIFFLSLRLAFFPHEAISGIIETVSFPVYAQLRNNPEQARELFRNALLGMVVLLIPSCLLLIALTPGLVEHVLGERWVETTTAIRILAVASLIGMIGDATTPLLKGFGLPSQVTILEILQSGLTLGLAWLLAGKYGLPGAVMAVLLGVAATQLLCVRFSLKLLDHPYAGLWQPLAIITSASLAGTMLTHWLENSVPGLTGFIMAATTGVIVTLGLIIVADRLLGHSILYPLARHFPAISRLLRIAGKS